MTYRIFVGCFVFCCVLFFRVNNAAASRSGFVLSFNRATVIPGRELVISCNTTWNNTYLFLYFTPIDVSLGEDQIGNTRFSLRPEEHDSRYIWSPIGSTGFNVKIEHAQQSDAGTYRCQDKRLKLDVRKYIALDAPETATIAISQDDRSSGNRKRIQSSDDELVTDAAVASEGGDSPVASEMSFFGSMSGLIMIIGGGVLAGIVFIVIAVCVALVRSRRSKADKEKGSMEESGYLKVNISQAALEFPSPYEPLTTYEEPINSKGVINHAMLAGPPTIYAECIPADEANVYAECVPPVETSTYAECVPVVEAKSQMSRNYMVVVG
jgi:hypothetical protein